MKKNTHNKAILKPTATKVIHEPGFTVQYEELLAIEPVILDDAAKAKSLDDIAARVEKAQARKPLTEEDKILRILKGERV